MTISPFSSTFPFHVSAASEGQPRHDPSPHADTLVAGRVLATLRTLRGLTQEALARAAALNKTAISDYETGKRQIPESRRRRLLAGLGLPLRAWDDTVRHVEWLEWLAHAEPSASSHASTRPQIRRIAQAAARDLERHLTDVLDILSHS